MNPNSGCKNRSVQVLEAGVEARDQMPHDILSLHHLTLSFKETIAKVLDKDTSLAEKILTLFREQGITIASILTAIGMAIGVLVEALLPGGGGAAACE